MFLAYWNDFFVFKLLAFHFNAIADETFGIDPFWKAPMVNLRKFLRSASNSKQTFYSLPARWPKKRPPRRSSTSVHRPSPAKKRRLSDEAAKSPPDSPPTTPTTSQVEPNGKKSPMKTRGVKKKHNKETIRCRTCGGVDGPFQECADCKTPFHLECLLYEAEAIAWLRNSAKWRCPKCVVCEKCKGFIDDPENVQCVKCDRAYHGRCRPKISNGGFLFL